MTKAKDFMEGLEKQAILKEEAKLNKYVFVDIETGQCMENNILDFYRKRIVKEVNKQKYEYKDNWKPETNLKKKEEFELQKPEKIQRLFQKIVEKSALSPFLNRIIIIGYELNGKFKQFNELEEAEFVFLETFTKDIAGKVFVAYTDFDIRTIETKLIKYGLKKTWDYYVDVSKFATFWSAYGKEFISQDEFAITLGIEPNKYNDLDAETFGDVFENYRNDFEQNKKLVQKILEYNKEDVRVLKEIFMKLYNSNMIG